MENLSKWQRRLSLFVFVLALFFLLFNLHRAPMIAQSVTQRLQLLEGSKEVSREADARIETKISAIESRLASVEQMKVDSRLAKLETQADTIHQLLIGITIAVAAQLVLQIIRFAQASKSSDRSRPE